MSALRDLAVCVIGGVALVGCSPHTGDPAPWELTDPSAEVVETVDGAELRIHGVLENTSDEALDGVTYNYVLADALSEYLTFGAVNLPAGMFDDIYPSDTPDSELPSGAALGFEITQPLPLDHTGSDLAQVLNQRDAIVLRVTWDGGEQEFPYTGPVLDPDGLLED